MAFKAKFNRYTGQTSLGIETFVVKTGETITRGMMCKVDSTTGIAEPADSGDTNIFGAAVNDAAAAATVELYVPGTVYAATDANARYVGATLDLDSNSTGLTTSSNKDFIVYRNSTATQDTLVFLTAEASIFEEEIDT